MTSTETRRSTQRRRGIGETGLILVSAVVLGMGGWALWTSGRYDRDLERRWALPFEAKALAEEEIDLTPRPVVELAEPDVKAATERYARALESIRADLAARRTTGEQPAADTPTELTRAGEAARNCLAVELDAATDKAERLAKELEAGTADRRRELRRQARDLVAEWDALFARHPEWPPQRLTPPPE